MEKVKKEGWVNIIRDNIAHEVFPSGELCPTKEDAEKCAFLYDGDDDFTYLDTVKVEWEE